ARVPRAGARSRRPSSSAGTRRSTLLCTESRARLARGHNVGCGNSRKPAFYMISRRQFLQFAAAATAQRAGKPRGHEFVFARLRYESGDWDYNPKVAANVLDSIV